MIGMDTGIHRCCLLLSIFVRVCLMYESCFILELNPSRM